jgi:hypothetical protein
MADVREVYFSLPEQAQWKAYSAAYDRIEQHLLPNSTTEQISAAVFLFLKRSIKRLAMGDARELLIRLGDEDH